MMGLRYLLSILLLSLTNMAYSQNLEGIWSGKISRHTNSYYGVEGLEIQLYQSGKSLWGSTFAFKDSARFVLFNVSGKRNKKTKTLELQEFSTPAYLLPEDFYPCEKNYALKWYKIGKTQYLAGTWGGIGVGVDTSCFPGEDLFVVLQKVKEPEYPPEIFFGMRIVNFLKKRDRMPPPIADPADSIITDPLPGAIAGAIPPPPNDSVPADRRQEIQHILKVKDTLVRIFIYDNAVVDNDTVTVYVNKKPVLIKQRISDKALYFEISLKEYSNIAEILMQAENLGSIPPNTCLMIVEYGENRYEARLNAGFDKHAVVVITYEPG